MLARCSSGLVGRETGLRGGNPVVGKVRLAALTREHEEQVEAYARTRGLSPSSIHLLRVIFSTALNAAIKWERPGVRNVVRLTTPAKIEKRTYTVLSPDDSRRLLDAASKGPYASVYATMLYCGLRVGEALALRWADIDLERRTIHVEHSLTRGDRGKRAELGPTKTRDSKRTFELSSIAAATLKEQRLSQLRHQAAAGERGVPLAERLGPGLHDASRRAGQSFDVAGVLGIRLKGAGPPPMRLHDLRHSCATLLHEAGVDCKEISHLMGHSQVSITQALYAHMTPLLRQRTAQAMDQMCSRVSASPNTGN